MLHRIHRNWDGAERLRNAHTMEHDEGFSSPHRAAHLTRESNWLLFSLITDVELTLPTELMSASHIEAAYLICLHLL